LGIVKILKYKLNVGFCNAVDVNDLVVVAGLTEP